MDFAFDPWGRSFPMRLPSQAPHQWESTLEVLVNNYFPAKETWQQREENQGVQWPDADQLDTLKEARPNKILHVQKKTMHCLIEFCFKIAFGNFLGPEGSQVAGKHWAVSRFAAATGARGARSGWLCRLLRGNRLRPTWSQGLERASCMVRWLSFPSSLF